MKKGGDQRFNDKDMLVGCSGGHFVTGFRKLDRNSTCGSCGLPHTYYCPICKIRVDLDVAGSPALPFVAGPSAGKSVLLAALAAELRHSPIPSRLGIEADYAEDYRGYWTKVVNPLWNQGELPRRTIPGEYSSLVAKLGGRGWSTHVARFSDAAGEVWTGRRPVDSTSDSERERLLSRQQATLSRAQSVVFLADPERDQELKGEIRHNIIEDIEQLLMTAGGLSSTKTVAEDHFRRLDAELGASNIVYPHRLPDRREIDVIFTRLGLATRLDRIAAKLEATWQDRCGRPSTLDDLQTYVQYVEQYNQQHRLAIVISKCDALGHRFEHYQRELASILSGAKLRDQRGWLARAADGHNWRAPMAKIVKLGRELAPESLARYLDSKRRTIPEVAFFFVSALGRKTEPVLVKYATPSAGSQDSMHALRDDGSRAEPPVRDATDASFHWRVDGLQMTEGSQRRKPTSENIWLPLLWILGGRP
jgi:hypothetical protein